MAIYCNDREIILSNTADPAVKFYLDHKKEIQKKKDYVVIKKYTSESVFLVDDKGRPLRPTIQTVPFTQVYRSKERGEERWTYAQNRRKLKNDRYSYDPSHLFVADEISLDPYEDVEKIFVLTVVGNLSGVGCYVYDPVDAAEKRAEKLGGDELDVRYLIYKDPETTDEDIVLLAQAWGLSGVEDINVKVLKNTLYDKVVAMEKNIEATGRGYRQFITDVKNLKNVALKERVENRAIIHKAIAEEIVRFEQRDSRWYYKSTGDFICQVNHDKLERKEDILLDFMTKHSNEFDALKTEVWSDKIKPTYSVADIDGMDTDKEVRIAAKNLGVKLPPRINLNEAKKQVIESISS
jgi:hypothetical protein